MLSIIIGKEIENAVLNEDTDKYSKTLEKLRVLSEKEVLYKKYKTYYYIY